MNRHHFLNSALFHRFFFLGFFLVIFQPLILLAQGEKKEEVPAMYFIIDASRSMWGRIDDKPKIDIAREVLGKLINEIPDGINTGVTVFGHRKENDCNDIEDISPFGVMDKQKTLDAINGVTPVGKTPLTDSISHVAEILKNYTGPKTVVLISDGMEACDKDPCAKTKELKEQGLDVRLHVIGLDVTEKEAEQLHCIADAGSGKYFQVSHTDELLTSLAVVQSSALSNVKIPAETTPYVSVIKKVPAPNAEKGSKGSGHIVIEHDNWLLRPLYWRLIDRETGEEAARYSDFEAKNVPAGSFSLAWRQYEHGSTEIILNDSVEVVAGETTTIELHTALRLGVPNWVKPPRFWGLEDIESKDQIVAFSSFEPFLVPPGEYQLIWRQYENLGDTLYFGSVEIDSGKVNYVTLNSSLSVFSPEWISAEPFYWGLKDPETGKWVARYYGSFDQQLIPPGKYNFVYRQSEFNSTDSVLGEVEVMAEEESQYTIDTGIKLVSKDPNFKLQLAEFTLVDAEDKPLSSVKLLNSFGPMPLKPGRYKVTYFKIGEAVEDTQDSGDEVELKQGELLEINLDDLLHSVSVVAATPEAKESPSASPTILEQSALQTPIKSREFPALEPEVKPSATPTVDPYPERAMP